MTLYLKYRPQKIADLDLTSVREMLEKMLSGDSLPHAFLFSGPRGTGKTSSARIVAKAINCPNKKNGEPCNKCEACQSITTGSAPDLIEIDAASNRGIDEIRALRDSIKLAPMNFAFKVYIIDEVHMLTSEAANALLKTLEEPPAHAIFILCTTDPQKLPATVVSRCTRINFVIPKKEESVAKLESIVKAEKITATTAALVMVADAGRGSFRDQIKTLEQVWLTHGEVTEDSVRKTLGLLESADPEKFIAMLKANDTEQLLKFVDNIVNHGVNVRAFLESLIIGLRSELLETRSKSILNLIEELDLAYEQTKTTAVPQLPLEMLIVKMSGDKPKEVKENLFKSVVEPTKVEQVKEEKAEVVQRTGNGLYKLEDINSKWQDILKAVRPQNHSIEALLRSTSPLEFNGQDLVLEVFYKFHKDKLESDKCRTLVEQTVENVFGVEKIKLKFKLGTKQKVQEISAAHVEEDILKAAEEIFKVDAV
jgi:DNA polymerase III subunit gamma/tau